MGKILGVILAIGALGLSACSQTADRIIKNVEVTGTQDKDNNTGLQLKAELGYSNLLFQNLTLPIGNNGSMKMQQGTDGKSYVLLGLNLTKLRADKALADANLPNGAAIPVTGVSNLKAYAVGNHSRLYLGTVNSKWVIGLAVVVDKFDQIAKSVPSANIFLPFSKGNGTAGFFTNPQASKSGFAFFVQTDVTVTQDPAAAMSAQGISLGKVTTVLKWVLSFAGGNQLKWFYYFLDLFTSHKQILTPQ